MKLGLFQNVQWPEATDQRTQFENAIEQTILAEQAGFDSAFFVEHHWTRHGILSSTLALLAYIAARTTRIRLGTAVLVIPLHDPVRLVEEASTVDLLSGGRLDLGVGRGFQWLEFDGFGLDIAESRARYDEALEVILKAWREPKLNHKGRYWRYGDVSVEPKPLQKPHPPVWAGAGNKESAKKVGRLGLRLMLSSGARFESITPMIDAYKSGLAEGSHAFSSDHVLLSRITHIAETRARAWEIAGPYYNWFRKTVAEVSQTPGQPSRFNAAPLTPKLHGPIGSERDDPGFLFCTPDEASRYIEEVAALGVGQVIFQGNWGGIPQDDMVRSLTLVGREVIPRFAAGVK
ncbi:MAG TPA: LLM class flavin-dependent oxidoreductase [Dehalococcoidia bacterium]|nr:LLM class flavin-dependent oxidoreductase [Dehalococcoidia bacterium]